MCRWLAYSGNAIPLSKLVLDTDHSLIDQSLAARSSEQTTNGDGFGIGWYDHFDTPGIYRSIQPAWNDSNLRELCLHLKSPLFLAHVRAATATPIQQTNCHPFRYKHWLFMHNGVIRDFASLKREMTLAINPALFGHIQGNTDSELMFMLALTFGMDSDVYAGVARMAGFVEETAAKKGIENPLQMTLAISDGKQLFAVRYSSEKQSRTLFYSASVSALRQLVPQEVEPELEVYGEQAMSVVSEPFHSLEGGWHAVAESTFLTVENGMVEQRSFVPTSV